MRRTKLITGMAVVFALLVMSTGGAYAFMSWGWNWNSEISVGDATVFTKWTVVGGDPGDYSARIQVQTKDVGIVEVADNETVTVKDKGKCGVVKATLVVTGPEVAGNERPVIVQLVTGDDLRSNKPTGALGKKIKVKLTIPGVNCDD